MSKNNVLNIWLTGVKKKSVQCHLIHIKDCAFLLWAFLHF